MATFNNDPAYGGDVKGYDLLQKAKSLYCGAATWDMLDRIAGVNDTRFAAGDQWDAGARAQRENQGRPILTINKVRKKIELIVGEYTQNRIQFKVVPCSGTDKEAADILGKYLIKIQKDCDAGYAYEWGFRQCVTGGRGFWRVANEYCDDYSFDQKPVVKRIVDPFLVAIDPYCKESDYSDMKYAFISTAMGKTEFMNTYPGKDPGVAGPWFTQGDSVTGFNFYYGGTDKTCFICEYYWVEEISDDLRRIKISRTSSDNIEEVLEVVSVLGAEYRKLKKNKELNIEVLDKRKVKRKRVMWATLSSGEILKEPTEIPCDFIPLVFCPGVEEINGQSRGFVSLIRDSKDSARSYNYARSSSVESVSLAPKSPYILTSEMIKGHESEWDTLNTFPRPYLKYNTDPSAPNATPQRVAPPDIQGALTQEAMVCEREISDTTGIYDAAMGQATNEVSARAITARAIGTMKSNFAYFRSLERAIIFTGKIMVSMLKRLNAEGREFTYTDEYGNEVSAVLTGINSGVFDVALDTSPEYETQRQEKLANLQDYLRQTPQTAGAVADIVAEAADWPGSSEIASRIRKTLPITMLSEEEAVVRARQEANIQKIVMDAQASITGGQPPPPTPEQQAEMMRMQMEAQKMQMEMEKQKVELEKEKIQLEIQKLKAVEQAQRTKEQETVTDAEAYGMGFNEKEFRKQIIKELAKMIPAMVGDQKK
jgi:hypothetical protein